MPPRPSRLVNFSLPTVREHSLPSEGTQVRHAAVISHGECTIPVSAWPRQVSRLAPTPPPVGPLPAPPDVRADAHPAAPDDLPRPPSPSPSLRRQPIPAQPPWATFVQRVEPERAEAATRLREVAVLPATGFVSFTVHAASKSRSRYGVRVPLALPDASISFQLERRATLFASPQRLAVVAGPMARRNALGVALPCAGGLECVQLVVGGRLASLLLWHGDSLTVLHSRYDAGQWEWLTATVRGLEAWGTYLLRRPEHAPLLLQGWGPHAQLFCAGSVQ